MNTLPTNTDFSLPVVPEFDAAPADLLEQIEAAQTEAADVMDAITQTTAQAIKNALSVAGIKSPEALADGAKALKSQLSIWLHLAAETFLLRRDSPELHFLEALREVVDTREKRARYWNAYCQGGDMVGAFQEWVEEERRNLETQLDLLEDEIGNLAPLVKTARERITRRLLQFVVRAAMGSAGSAGTHRSERRSNPVRGVRAS